MPSYPIEDLREIKKVVELMQDFNPKKDSIADFLKEVNLNLEKINVVLRKYWP